MLVHGRIASNGNVNYSVFLDIYLASYRPLERPTLFSLINDVRMYLNETLEFDKWLLMVNKSNVSCQFEIHVIS